MGKGKPGSRKWEGAARFAHPHTPWLEADPPRWEWPRREAVGFLEAFSITMKTMTAALRAPSRD
jgi:hypothetical protein